MKDPFSGAIGAVTTSATPETVRATAFNTPLNVPAVMPNNGLFVSCVVSTMDFGSSVQPKSTFLVPLAALLPTLKRYAVLSALALVGLSAVLGSAVPVVGTFHADVGGFARQVYRLGSPLLRRTVRSMAATTAVSPVAASAVSSFADPTIVPNGLDVDDYRAANRRTPHTVVFLGRDDPRKGLDVLLDAWPAVRASVPDAQLRVLGSHRDHSEPGVSYLGRVSEEVKRAELAAATVFCAPNLGGESFGIVLVEAMASGCIPVVSDLEAFASVVGPVGHRVPVGDAGQLAVALVETIDGDGPSPGEAADARERAMRFDRRVVLEAYLEVYRRARDSG